MEKNKTTQLLDFIQFKTGMDLGQIAEKLGRNRTYLSQAKSAKDNHTLVSLIETVFADVLGGYQMSKKAPPDPVTMLQDQVQDLRKHNEQLTKMNDALIDQVKVNFADVQLRLQEQADLIAQGQTLQVALSANWDERKMHEIADKMDKIRGGAKIQKKGKRNSA